MMMCNTGKTISQTLLTWLKPKNPIMDPNPCFKSQDKNNVNN